MTRPIAEAVERCILLVLLALIPLRVVLNETATFEVPRMFRHLDAPAGASPATSMAIFCLILAAAATLIVVRMNAPGQRYRATGLEIGSAVLIVAMAISTWRAGQKHLALVGSLNFLGILIFAIVLAQLMTRPWRIRLTLAVVLATGALLVVKSAQQRWVEMPATIKYYEAHKAELLGDKASAAGNPRDEGLRHDYEQRMKSGAVTGFFSHPNVLGSVLALLIPVALAIALANWRASLRVSAVAATIVALAALPALAWTQSKGAGAACAIAIGVMVCGKMGARWLRRNSRTAFVGVWIAALVVAAGLAITLRVSPDALGRSMLFRSMYWQAAGLMIQDRGLLGVGAGNFGRYFTQYKGVECPEEVDDPHSWPIRALTEWGVVGLAGMLLLLGGYSWRIANHSVDADETDSSNSQTGSLVLWMAGIGLAAFGWIAAILSTGDIGYVSLTLGPVMLAWFVVMCALLWTRGAPRISPAPCGAIVAGLIGGQIGFLLHSAVDLAMFDAGAATVFFAIVAITTGLLPSSRHNIRATVAPNRKWAAIVAICFIAVAATVTYLGVPMAKIGSDLQIARTADRPAKWDAYCASPSHAAYQRAASVYPLDGVALQELIEELLGRVGLLEHISAIEPLVAEFRRRDPANAASWHQLATLSYQRYELGRDVNDLYPAVDFARHAVSAYPTSPEKRLVLADLLEKLAGATGSLETRRDAAKELQTALELESRRVYVSKPHRMSAKDRDALEQRLRRLRS